MKQIILFIFLVTFLNLIEAQNVKRNRHYMLKSKIEYKVLLKPYFFSGSNYYNNIFYKTFNRDGISVVDTSIIIRNIHSDQIFNNSLRKTVYINLDDSCLSKNYNLYSSLSQTEIKNLKNNCLNADFLIVLPNIIARTIRKTNGCEIIRLTGNIIVFDLSTGEFILKITSRVRKKYPQMDSKIVYPIEELANNLFECFKKNIK